MNDYALAPSPWVIANHEINPIRSFNYTSGGWQLCIVLHYQQRGTYGVESAIPVGEACPVLSFNRSYVVGMNLGNENSKLQSIIGLPSMTNG
jgi:hypothetical protein